MVDIQFRSDMTVELRQSMGNDDTIIQAMLVSTQAEDSKDAEADYGRINFLMSNRHGTPFEHAAMTFYIEAPIFVFREFHRHRIGWSYNEVSGRYRELDPIFYIPSEQRNLVQIGKPGHYEFIPGDPGQYNIAVNNITKSCEVAYNSYQNSLHFDTAKEVARMCLPVNIYSAMYATCNPRSLMAFLSLRTKDNRSTYPSFPMREIEMVAEKMEQEFGRLFPITYDSFCNNGRVCP